MCYIAFKQIDGAVAMSLYGKTKKILINIYNRIVETRVLEAAAAIAYYAIFSFFPLILFLIALNSSFLKSAEVQGQILKFVQHYLPGSGDIVKANIQHLIHSSRAVGIFGTIVLLWSSSLVFAGFSQNINLAWTNSKTRHFLIERLIGLMMIGILIICMILSLITNTLVQLIPEFAPKFMSVYFSEISGLYQFLIDYLPVVLIFVLFVLLYKYTPSVKVLWRESIIGSLFSVIALETTKSGFIYYLAKGTGSYRLVYGSLGAVVAFMLWVYISSCIVLLGGHICAAVANHNRLKQIDRRKKNTPVIHENKSPSDDDALL